MQEAEDEAQYVKQRSGSKSQSKSKEKQHPFQKVVNVRQAKQEALQVEDYDEDDSNRQHAKAADRRSESRLERRRNDEVVDSYDYYGD